MGGEVIHQGYQAARVPDLVGFGVEVRTGARHRGVVRLDNRSFLCDCGQQDSPPGLRGHVFELTEGNHVFITHVRGDRRTYTPSWH